jgi:hypothetical protein
MNARISHTAVCILLSPLLFNGCSQVAPSPSAPASASTEAFASAQKSGGRATSVKTGDAPYFDRPVTAADLEGRSLRELSIMRNVIFARAGNPFRKKWLREYFTQQPWYRPLKRMDDAKLTPLDRKNAAFIAEYEAKIPRETLEERKGDILTKAAAERTPEDRIELQLLAQALGEPTNESGVEKSPLDTPEMLDALLTVEQLGNYSRRDLRLLRNMVYARRGRTFKSPALQEYFDRMAWYAPDQAYSDARLTDLDRRNVKIIASVEQELGGALTDREMDQEWFGGA